MKVLIWFLCFFALALIQTIFRMNGILLGAIPTVILFSTTWWAARKLCTLWDARKNAKEQKPAPKKDTEVEGGDVSYATDLSASVETGSSFGKVSPEPSPHTKRFSLRKKSDQKRFCKYCGSVIDSETRGCPGCGKRYTNAKIVLLRLCLLVAIVSVVSVSLYGAINYSNAVNAKNNQHFIEARKYYDNLLIADKLFPDDYAYVTAGTLMERNAHILALNAFEELEDYDIPASIIKALKETIYMTGQNFYRQQNYSSAARYFEAINGYRRSADYEFLLMCHIEGTEDLTDSELKNLSLLIGFEDASDIILAEESTAVSFLEGNWESGDIYFRIRAQTDGSINSYYNLPIADPKDHFSIQDGNFLTFPDDNISYQTYLDCKNNPHFRFGIIDRNTIFVHCFKDGSAYVLYRQ